MCLSSPKLSDIFDSDLEPKNRSLYLDITKAIKIHLY